MSLRVREDDTVQLQLHAAQATAQAGSSGSLLTIDKHDPAYSAVPLVSGKRLAKWIQKDMLEHCQLLMVNQVEEDTVLAGVTVQAAPVDKWEAVVPGKDPCSLQLRALLMSKAHLCADEQVGLPPARVPREVVPLLPDAAPVIKPMFRYSPLEMEEMQKQVKAPPPLNLSMSSGPS